LIPIENILSKRPKTKEESTPSFLRLGGFLWVDFQNKITVERNEEEILKRLADENSILLVGNQASGKSVILRSVGYKLANDGFIVFFVDADSLNIDLALTDIRNWDMSNVVVLVDDVHRNLITVSDFMDKAHSNNVKFVLSSRPTSFDALREGQGNRLLDLFNKRIEVRVSEQTIYDMVVKYCKSLGVHFTRSVGGELAYFKPSTDEINEIIQKCGTDLWLTTYLLAAWNPKKGSIKDIAKADMYEKVYETRVSKWRIADRNSLQAMQIVCALYQFEIPCAEAYLVDMNLDNSAMKLLSEGHLIRRGRYYYLHHPSVARIYLETLEYCSLIKNPTNLSIDILTSYLEKSEKERPQVFYKLSTFPKSMEKETIILKGMLQQIKFEDLISQVKQEENCEKIGLFFRSVSNIDIASAKEILSKLGQEVLMKKILHDPFVKNQKSLVAALSQIDENLAKMLYSNRELVAVVIPLFNEEKRVSNLFRNLFNFADIAVVVDDGSRDATSEKASKMGAKVVRHSAKKGLIPAITTGLKEALNQDADIVILDIFPWIDRKYIPRLITPILNRDADLVVGLRKNKTDYIQALNRKAVEKFLKYLPSKAFRGEGSLSITNILFSKILRVKETEIEMLIPTLEVMEARLHSIAYMKARYYRGVHGEYSLVPVKNYPEYEP
jgi:hypothetical protein